MRKSYYIILLSLGVFIGCRKKYTCSCYYQINYYDKNGNLNNEYSDVNHTFSNKMTKEKARKECLRVEEIERSISYAHYKAYSNSNTTSPIIAGTKGPTCYLK